MRPLLLAICVGLHAQGAFAQQAAEVPDASPADAATYAADAQPEPSAVDASVPTAALATSTEDPVLRNAREDSSPGATSNEESEPGGAFTHESFQAPAFPAMVLLNADVSNIDRPGSVRDLGISVSNMITPQGTFRSGASIEVTPRLLGLTRGVTAYDYRKNWITRFLANIGVSLATTSESAREGGPAVTRLATGLRLVLWDEADPLLDPRSIDALKYAEKECAGVPSSEIARCAKDKGEEFLKLAQPRWNLGGLAVAGALAAAFVEGEIGDGDFDSAAVWATGAVPLGEWGQAALSGRYRKLDASDFDAGVFARLRAGSAATRGYVEAGLLGEKVAAADLEARGRLMIGAEVRIAKSAWLTASLGGNVGKAPGESSLVDIFALSNIEWALDEEPSFRVGAK